MTTLGRLGLMAVCLAFFASGYLLTNHFTQASPSFWSLATALDHNIPFIPEAVWLYALEIPVPAAVVYLLSEKDMKEAILGMLTAFVIANVTFVLVPVNIATLREAQLPETLSGSFVGFLYQLDGPTNCFPSLHVTFSIYAALWAYLRFPRRIGIPFVLLGAAIAISTMLIKQHFVADVVGGGALAISVFLAQRPYRQA